MALVNWGICKDSEAHMCEYQGSTFLSLRSSSLCLTYWFSTGTSITSVLPAGPLPCLCPSPQCFSCSHLSSVQTQPLMWTIFLYQGILQAVKSHLSDFNVCSLLCQWTSGLEKGSCHCSPLSKLSLHKESEFPRPIGPSTGEESNQ